MSLDVTIPLYMGFLVEDKLAGVIILDVDLSLLTRGVLKEDKPWTGREKGEDEQQLQYNIYPSAARYLMG